MTTQSLSNLDYTNPLVEFSMKFPEVMISTGKSIFSDSAQPLFFYYIVEGTVRLSRITEEGEKLNLHVFYPGSCISLLSLVGANDHFDFEALSDLKVRQIPRDEFLSEARRNAPLSFELTLHAMRGMKGLLHRIEKLTTSSALEQVAGILVYFTKHQHKQLAAAGPITISTTHLEIAEWVGLTRENVSLQLRKLEELGVITRGQQYVEILDLTALQNLTRTAKLSTR